MNQALEKLKKLKNVYQDFEEVKAGEDLFAKLRPLSSEEETEVHAYAAEKYDQGLSFLYAIKRETLCRAMIELNGVTLEDFIEDTKEDGSVEKVTRSIWLRENVVCGWNQLLVDKFWLGYGNLLNRLEEKISGGIKTEADESEENEDA